MSKKLKIQFLETATSRKMYVENPNHAWFGIKSKQAGAGLLSLTS